MSPDEAKVELVRQWLAKVEHDLAAVERALQPPPIADVAVFHCQQAAEKALKAYLTWHDQPFRKTHLLQELVRQCAALDPAFAALAAAAATLTPYASEFRYPEGPADPTPEATVEALRLAQLVVAFVHQRLPASVRL